MGGCPKRGGHVLRMAISLEEAASGGERRFHSEEGKVEEIYVKIPPGYSSGKKLRVAVKERWVETRAGHPGDLYLQISH